MRLLERGNMLRNTMEQNWRERGRYADALDITRLAFVQDHFATTQRPETGIVVMNMHKAKGKQFDEVIIFEGWPVRVGKEVKANPDRIVRENRPGTLAHRAVTLMLYTGAARVDAVQLGPWNIKGDRVEYRRQKTKRSGGILISVPLHDDLRRILEELAADRPFLATASGKQRSAAGLGNAMRKWCDEAGLDVCTSHGLRKACARRLAEAGATPHEIAAVTGHKTLALAQLYTEAAGREGLADAAFEKLIARPNGEQNVVNLHERFAKGDTNTLEGKEKP
ncbi:hypothetical protein BV509_17560 [Rhodovulum sulfidophilum]|nr:hypothetical protein BV509_17560 [Rhodovulum sulfidophilum]